MNKEKWIEEKCAVYNEAYDFYMDCQQLPDNLPQDDLLGNHLKTTLNAYPDIQKQDATWIEVLKEDLLTFYHAMLTAFASIEEEQEKELAYIQKYQNGDLEEQRAMWGDVYRYVKGNYNSNEVNIDGYVQLFKGNNTQDVINALSNDWRQASEQSKYEREERLLHKEKIKFERNIELCGSTDYQEKKRIEKIIFKYPALQEIIRIIGRETPQRKDEKDDISYHYIPILVSTPTFTQEIEQVSVGNDLGHMMPIETALLSEPATETLFYKRFAEKQLQVLTNRPPIIAQEKKEQINQEKPRLEMGPIIVCMDTSGSMLGEPEQIAHSLLLQLIDTAKRKKRKCYVITFAVRAQAIELTHPAHWKKVNEFLENRFSGGTNGEEMLAASINALQTENFCMADILIISDFEFPHPLPKTQSRMDGEHKKGTRFYGLQIGLHNNNYDMILDKIWKLKL